MGHHLVEIACGISLSLYKTPFLAPQKLNRLLMGRRRRGADCSKGMEDGEVKKQGKPAFRGRDSLNVAESVQIEEREMRNLGKEIVAKYI